MRIFGTGCKGGKKSRWHSPAAGLTAIIFPSTIEVEKIIEAFMQTSRIYSDDWDIDARLSEFNVTRAELYAVVREVVGARGSTVPDDPLSAGGQFAYIFGTRYLRSLLRSKGWLVSRRDNIEANVHPDRNLKVVHQNVDGACNPLRTPQALSEKGSGSARAVAQGYLFSEEEMSALALRATYLPPTGTWFFCVSIDGDDVRAELSKATRVSGGNFDTFEERIFIVRKGEWDKIRVHGGDDASDAIELEPVVRRK